MKVKKSKTIEAYIPTASMADIAFLLIIFFMVSSVFPVDKTQVELPTTADYKHYNEDSAVISITTEELEDVREDRGRDINSLEPRLRMKQKVKIRSTTGKQLSSEWNLVYPIQENYQTLKDLTRDFVQKVDDRIREESQGKASRVNVIIVIKADAKVPFYAVDAVVQALQDYGGVTASNVAILTKLNE